MLKFFTKISVTIRDSFKMSVTIPDSFKILVNNSGLEQPCFVSVTC